jgi:molybdopterin converting factor small subunit
MVKIKVNFYSLIADITKKTNILLSIEEKSTVNEILSHLFKQLGKQFESLIMSSPGILNSRIIILVNEKNIRDIHGLNSIVNINESISFLPAIAGG